MTEFILFFAVESPESIHDSWVKIPTDWRPSEEGTTSSEQYLPSHAQASFYSSGSSGGSSYRRGSYGHGPKSGGGNGPDGQPEPYFDHAMMTNLSGIAIYLIVIKRHFNEAYGCKIRCLFGTSFFKHFFLHQV